MPSKAIAVFAASAIAPPDEHREPRGPPSVAGDLQDITRGSRKGARPAVEIENPTGRAEGARELARHEVTGLALSRNRDAILPAQLFHAPRDHRLSVGPVRVGRRVRHEE